MYRKSPWMSGSPRTVIKSVDVFKDHSTLRFLESALKRDAETNLFLSPAFLKTVMRTYSLKGWYFICVSDGELCGAASFFSKPNIMGRNILTTVPGGFWAKNQEAEEMLVQGAIQVASQQKLVGPCFKDIGSRLSGFGKSKTAYRAVMHLPKNNEELKKLFSKNIQRDIRSAEKRGIEVAESSDLRQFYKVWAQRMRDLGTPVIPFTFFDNMKTFFKDNMFLLLAKKEGQCIGGVVLLKQGNSLVDPYLGCLSEALKFCTAPFLYYKMLRLAVEQGYRFFDLGRSQPGSGNERFKLRFGTKLEPLYSYGGKDPIQADSSLQNLVASGWKHMPLVAANILGPRMRRYMPFG